MSSRGFQPADLKQRPSDKVITKKMDGMRSEKHLLDKAWNRGISINSGEAIGLGVEISPKSKKRYKYLWTMMLLWAPTSPEHVWSYISNNITDKMQCKFIVDADKTASFDYPVLYLYLYVQVPSAHPELGRAKVWVHTVWCPVRQHATLSNASETKMTRIDANPPVYIVLLYVRWFWKYRRKVDILLGWETEFQTREIETQSAISTSRGSS